MEPSEIQENFKKNIHDKYVIFSSLFSNLPYTGITNVGNLIPIFYYLCKTGLHNNKSPEEIINHFFTKYYSFETISEAQKQNDLFKYIQFIERQVVLFDALEDSGFSTVNDMQGPGTLTNFINSNNSAKNNPILKHHLSTFKVRIVLTAHPTQFYPSGVLSIIHDLSDSILKNDFDTINEYLKQLGITPFFNKEKPTPLDEAKNLMWYLENVFYTTLGDIYSNIVNKIFDFNNNEDFILNHFHNPIIELGFWPGGDRDGNPNVTSLTTLKVAKDLHKSIITCYYRDIRQLKRYLTFSKIDHLLAVLEDLLFKNIFIPEQTKPVTAQDILNQLLTIRQIIIKDCFKLHLEKLDSLIFKVKIFGTHFATLDIRQDSRINRNILLKINAALVSNNAPPILPKDYEKLSEIEKIKILQLIIYPQKLENIVFDDEVKDALLTMQYILKIQAMCGGMSCNRFIISNCQSLSNVLELFYLLQLAGHDELVSQVDIVPLFETISDLENADEIMHHLFLNKTYKSHLLTRHKQQTIMLGFSDGTKDGGYMQANYSIYKAKVQLSAIARKHKIKIVFFDGRGGPPSRGGGKTHKFYASLDNSILTEQIQVTIQGQTITSNFGTKKSAQYNLEQLLTAGLKNKLEIQAEPPFTKIEKFLFESLGNIAFEAYKKLKNDKNFLLYLQTVSPLQFYSETNIASRPTKRNKDGQITLDGLRAIPFVGSWSQLKQNVPGFYGMGTALKQLKLKGYWDDLKNLYQNNLFFSTLIDNSMMAMLKSNFTLTQHLQKDPQFGKFWHNLKAEYILTEKLYLELTHNKVLLEKEAVGRESILMREKIVLPLLVIQQYALCKLRTMAKDDPTYNTFTKLVTRSMFGIINAARNAV